MRKTLALMGALALLAADATPIRASGGVSVKINVSIREVQCTAEQRTRIRACAEPTQTVGLAPFKQARVAQTRVDAPPVYNIEVDPTRQVLIRTILY